jgi:hypothetical protein
VTARRQRAARSGLLQVAGRDLPAAAAGGAVPAPPRTDPSRRRETVGDLLAIHLETTVPLRILELRQAGEAERMRLAREAAAQIAAHGDDIQFRAARRGATASAAGWLVTGLAVAAFQPGGVRFGDLAWCATHLTRRRAPGETICAACLEAE